MVNIVQWLYGKLDPLDNYCHSMIKKNFRENIRTIVQEYEIKSDSQFGLINIPLKSEKRFAD